MSELASNPVRDGVREFLASHECEHVKIDEAGVSRITELVMSGEPRLPEWRGRQFYEEDRLFPEFCIVGNSINQMFWDFSTDEYPRVVRPQVDCYKGADAMWFSLVRYFTEYWPFTAFGVDIDLMQKYLRFLPAWTVRQKQLVRLLDMLGGLRIRQFLDDRMLAYDDGDGIVDLLTSHDAFRDETCGIPFDKRAQLFVAMCYERLGEQFPVDDFESLTVFADYRVPQALMSIGALKPSSDLQTKLNFSRIIPRNSQEEVEIRACTVRAVDLAVLACREQGLRGASAPLVDSVLWHWARTGVQRWPHHLTITEAY